LPENTESLAYTQKHSTHSLRVAIETLETLLGAATVEAIIDDLEKQGLPLTNAHAEYSFKEIQSALEYYFGDQIALFLLRHIKKGLARKLG